MGVIELSFTLRLENPEAIYKEFLQKLKATIEEAFSSAAPALFMAPALEKVFGADPDVGAVMDCAAPVPPPVPTVKTKVAPPQAIRWTEERVTALARMRDAGGSWVQIHAALNKMTGPAIASPDSVMVKWYDLKKSGRLPELPKVQAKPAAPKPAGVCKVSHETARHWAGERGLVTAADELDMPKVNAKRTALGLPLWELDSRAGRQSS